MKISALILIAIIVKLDGAVTPSKWKSGYLQVTRLSLENTSNFINEESQMQVEIIPIIKSEKEVDERMELIKPTVNSFEGKSEKVSTISYDVNAAEGRVPISQVLEHRVGEGSTISRDSKTEEISKAVMFTMYMTVVGTSLALLVPTYLIIVIMKYKGRCKKGCQMDPKVHKVQDPNTGGVWFTRGSSPEGFNSISGGSPEDTRDANEMEPYGPIYRNDHRSIYI